MVENNLDAIVRVKALQGIKIDGATVLQGDVVETTLNTANYLKSNKSVVIVDIDEPLFSGKLEDQAFKSARKELAEINAEVEIEKEKNTVLKSIAEKKEVLKKAKKENEKLLKDAQGE